LNGKRFGPANGNGYRFYSGFRGTRRFYITCVERKDGGWRFLDGSDGLLGFEADGRCNGIELFRGRKLAGLSRGSWLFVPLWKGSVRGRQVEGKKDSHDEEGFERTEARDHQGREVGVVVVVVVVVDIDIDMDMDIGQRRSEMVKK
jgi:hypothetical protein